MTRKAHIITKLPLLLASFAAMVGVAFGQATSADCINAVPVCNNLYDVPVLVIPPNNVPNEINGTTSCLSNGEQNGVWYTFTVQTSGILAFNIVPYNANDDYDWGLWNLTNANCSDIFGNASLQTSCNFSSSTTNNGITGANGGPNPQDRPTIPVSAGQRYVLYISNFSQTSSGYQLDFSQSTAQIPDNVSPTLVSATPNNPCGATRIDLVFSENISCNTVSASDFTFTGPGGPYTVTAVNGPGCASGSAYSTTYSLYISPPISMGGNFNVAVTGSISDVCGNSVANNVNTSFNYSALILDSTVVDASCGVNDGQATVNVSGGTPPYTFLWDDPAAQTTQTATNLARGTYHVTVTDHLGCRSTLTVVVSDPTSFTFTLTQVPDTCDKGSGSISLQINGTTPPYTINWNNITTNTNTTYNGTQGDSTFYIRITDVLGCYLDTTITIDNILNDSLEAFFTTDDESVDFLFPYATFFNASQHYVSILWYLPGSATSTAEIVEYNFTNDTLGDYPISVIAIDKDGCRDTFTLIVNLYTQFAMYIPNAFTVNSDGLNERFFVKGLGIDPDRFEMRIFDRGGQCIFVTTDPDLGWDGNIDGIQPGQAKMDVYVYKISGTDIYGKPYNFTGKVTKIH